MNSKLSRLAITNASNIIINQLYMKTGLDFTRPIHIHPQLSVQCNSRCVMCHCWRKPTDGELPAEIWIRALEELRRLSGNIKVCFAGGEVLLKKDVFDIFRFCHEKRIIWGLTSHGFILGQKNARKLVDLDPFNIHISLDSLDENIYEQIRGVQMLSAVMRNVSGLVDTLARMGSSTVVTIKTMVCKTNLDELDQIALYAERVGTQGITFQPVMEVTREAKDLFVGDQMALDRKIRQLIAMKRDGCPILNSEESLNSWRGYFANGRAKPLGAAPHQQAALASTNGHCEVPLRNLYILADGRVKVCELYAESLGNIRDQSITDILRSGPTLRMKQDLVGCERNCVYCIKRSAKDYLTAASKFFAPARINGRP